MSVKDRHMQVRCHLAESCRVLRISLADAIDG